MALYPEFKLNKEKVFLMEKKRRKIHQSSEQKNLKQTSNNLAQWPPKQLPWEEIPMRTKKGLNAIFRGQSPIVHLGDCHKAFILLVGSFSGRIGLKAMDFVFLAFESDIQYPLLFLSGWVLMTSLFGSPWKLFHNSLVSFIYNIYRISFDKQCHCSRKFEVKDLEGTEFYFSLYVNDG